MFNSPMETKLEEVATALYDEATYLLQGLACTAYSGGLLAFQARPCGARATASYYIYHLFFRNRTGSTRSLTNHCQKASILFLGGGSS